MECSRHDRLPARREVEQEKKGEKGRDHIRALWFAEARGEFSNWCVVGCASTKFGKQIRCFCWVWLLVALFAGPKISACHGQWAMNYLVRDAALFLHLHLLVFGQSKTYRCVFFLFFFVVFQLSCLNRGAVGDGRKYKSPNF